MNVSKFGYISLVDFCCRSIVMNIRAFAANMVFLDTLPFNGFLKGLLSPKSECMLFSVDNWKTT